MSKVICIILMIWFSRIALLYKLYIILQNNIPGMKSCSTYVSKTLGISYCTHTNLRSFLTPVCMQTVLHQDVSELLHKCHSTIAFYQCSMIVWLYKNSCQINYTMSSCFHLWCSSLYSTIRIHESLNGSLSSKQNHPSMIAHYIYLSSYIALIHVHAVAMSGTTCYTILPLEMSVYPHIIR